MRRLLLGMAIAATAALLPAVSQADDHQIAEFIKSRLQVEQQRGNLRGFNVDMRVDQGTVWFKGHVSDAAQERLILSTAQKAGYLGVVQVVDDIEIQGAAKPTVAPTPVQLMPTEMTQEPEYYRAASYQEPSNYVPPRQTQLPTTPAANNNVYSNGAPLPFAQASPAAMGQIPATQVGMPMPRQAAQGMPPQGGPMPMGMGGDAMSGTPNLPGYAWPGYAASPNYAALSYPKQYSPAAWPYIGPFYPYPQVPMGWRKVTLEWDDGWWFLDFKDR